MTFIILHLNEPGRQASKVALAVAHISSVREVADDAGTEVRLSDGSIVNVIETYKAIIDAACQVWRKLLTQPFSITSIGKREWAHVGRSS